MSNPSRPDHKKHNDSHQSASDAISDFARAKAAANDVPPELAPKDPRDTRGSVIDRRVWPDRRQIVVNGKLMNPDGTEATPGESGFERRRGPGRRLSDFTRSAEEGEMTKEQFMFLVAIDEFKKANDKAYPTWTDVLEVVRLLGYRKTQRSEIALRRADDWVELPDTASNVRPARWHERHRGADGAAA